MLIIVQQIHSLSSGAVCGELVRRITVIIKSVYYCINLIMQLRQA